MSPVNANFIIHVAALIANLYVQFTALRIPLATSSVALAPLTIPSATYRAALATFTNTTAPRTIFSAIVSVT